MQVETGAQLQPRGSQILECGCPWPGGRASIETPLFIMTSVALPTDLAHVLILALFVNPRHSRIAETK